MVSDSVFGVVVVVGVAVGILMESGRILFIESITGVAISAPRTRGLARIGWITGLSLG